MENVPLIKTSIGKDLYGRTLLPDSVDEDSLNHQDVLAQVIQVQGTERTNANLYAAICAGQDIGGMPLDPASIYDRGHELDTSSSTFDDDLEKLPLHTFSIPPSRLLSLYSDSFRSFAAGLSGADSGLRTPEGSSSDNGASSEISNPSKHSDQQQEE